MVPVKIRIPNLLFLTSLYRYDNVKQLAINLRDAVEYIRSSKYRHTLFDVTWNIGVDLGQNSNIDSSKSQEITNMIYNQVKFLKKYDINYNVYGIVTDKKYDQKVFNELIHNYLYNNPDYEAYFMILDDDNYIGAQLLTTYINLHKKELAKDMIIYSMIYESGVTQPQNSHWGYNWKKSNADPSRTMIKLKVWDEVGGIHDLLDNGQWGSESTGNSYDIFWFGPLGEMMYNQDRLCFASDLYDNWMGIADINNCFHNGLWTQDQLDDLERHFIGTEVVSYVYVRGLDESNPMRCVIPVDTELYNKLLPVIKAHYNYKYK